MIENRVTEEDGPELSREGDDVAMSSFNGKEKHGKRIGKRESSPIPDEDSMGILVFNYSSPAFANLQFGDLQVT